MNQLETNLILWAICAILLFELLVVICVCRCFFNRIKAKRFYVKREEYEYLHGNGGKQSQFQSTILRPPHADELALIGTIRAQNPSATFENGVENFGFYRDNDDDDIFLPAGSKLPSHMDWLELRPPPPPTASGFIHTEHLPAADYEIRPHVNNHYLYTHQSPPLRASIIDFRSYRDEYDVDEANFQPLATAGVDDDDEVEHFRFHSLRRPEIMFSHLQRTDTSTESFGGNYSTLIPRSILKGSTSTTPPLDILSASYSPKQHDRSPPRYDQSPRISVKINTDESIAMDHPTYAIEMIIPTDSSTIALGPSSTSSLSSTHHMRFASVSHLNDVEWEVPREFQTVVCDSTDDKQALRSSIAFSSNENLNYNNNNNNDKLSLRQRSQSAVADQRSNVSRIFIPWDHEMQLGPPRHLLNDIDDGYDATQQQAFEY